jgi:hypothetical protein
MAPVAEDVGVWRFSQYCRVDFDSDERAADRNVPSNCAEYNRAGDHSAGWEIDKNGELRPAARLDISYPATLIFRD